MWREADYSTVSVEVKNAWGYTSIPQYIVMAWYLIKQWLCLHGVVLS